MSARIWVSNWCAFSVGIICLSRLSVVIHCWLAIDQALPDHFLEHVGRGWCPQAVLDLDVFLKNGVQAALGQNVEQNATLGAAEFIFAGKFIKLAPNLIGQH